MHRRELRAISAIRIDEAKVLLDAGRFAGAYYLAGYAVECALKAVIARRVHSGDFPDKSLAESAYTHDLVRLARVAGVEGDLEAARSVNASLDVNWAIAKDWNETARYTAIRTAGEALALYGACAGRNGILPWVKKRW